MSDFFRLAKRINGDTLLVEADIISSGHEVIMAAHIFKLKRED